jgi:hypothetical protein
MEIIAISVGLLVIMIATVDSVPMEEFKDVKDVNELEGAQEIPARGIKELLENFPWIQRMQVCSEM